MNELTVTHGHQRVVLVPGQVAFVGRRAGSAVVVTDERVSREHLRLSWGTGGWLLESVGRSGTFVLGQPVTRCALGQAVEARLAVPDGPVVRFEPAIAPAPPERPAPEAAVSPPSPVPAAEPMPGGQVLGALRVLIPITAWLRDPAMRQWQRLLVAMYALTPLVLLIVLQHTANLVTLGWVYCLYVAPLWAIVFW